MNWRLLNFGVVVSLMLIGRSSYAFDLSGAWATNQSACKDIFALGPGRTLLMKDDSDLYGSGFIARGKEIIGKMQKYKILSAKESKNVVRLVAACSTDVALGHVQFAFRIDNDNKITRFYPGIEELNVSYWRCPLN